MVNPVLAMKQVKLKRAFNSDWRIVVCLTETIRSCLSVEFRRCVLYYSVIAHSKHYIHSMRIFEILLFVRLDMISLF